MRWAVLATLALSACVDSSDANVDIGLVDDGRQTDASFIDMPSVARPGQPFTVTVTTIGGGCTKPSSTEVLTTDADATVTPYDRYAAADVPCTRDLSWIAHTATLHFDVPGTRTVRIQVRNNAADVVTFERPIRIAY